MTKQDDGTYLVTYTYGFDNANYGLKTLTTTFGKSTVVYGDVNGDGKINSGDAALTYAYVNGKIKFKEDIAMMEDTIFYIDILLNNNDIFFSEYITYHYYHNKNSASRSIKNCIRNYQDAFKVHKIIREKLKRKKLLTDRRKELLNSKTSKIIADTINNIYRYDKKILQDLYGEIIKSKEIMEILQNCNKEYIDTHNYIIIYFLKNKYYNNLKNFLFLRKIMAKIKDFLTGRYK